MTKRILKITGNSKILKALNIEIPSIVPRDVDLVLKILSATKKK